MITNIANKKRLAINSLIQRICKLNLFNVKIFRKKEGKSKVVIIETEKQ